MSEEHYSATPVRHPPRLLVKTLTVTFVTVALLLVVVFAVVTLSMRDQVKRTVVEKLEASQRIFAAFEARRQRELGALAATLAESPTLKAAVETYATEVQYGGQPVGDDLLTTIQRELEKVAASIDADVVVVVDAARTTLASAGPSRDRWPSDADLSLAEAGVDWFAYNGVVKAGDAAFRVVTVPLTLADTLIGGLTVATSVDQGYAASLKALSGTEVVITRRGEALASTVAAEATERFEAVVAKAAPTEGSVELAGGPHAFRELVRVGDTTFYALDSIDASSDRTMRETMQNLVLVAVGAVLLAFVGSLWLARLLSEPIGRLSAELAEMKASRDVHRRLPITGSSLEVDTLTDTFNALFASVAQAEAQSEAACAGAIRALATALDARDPYTAGHSERVAVLSMAIGRTLGLSSGDLEILRLGALLHDIGKIGVPDDVLRKSGPLTDAEFSAIKQHPGLGARILRPVSFLSHQIPIVELHHERPDGRGYPYGLCGDDIPLEARIVHVADAYDAMTSARAYRHAMPPADALHELWRCAGTEYHAEIVGALATALPGLAPGADLREVETVPG